MKRQSLAVVLLLLVAATASACGTMAAPPPLVTDVPLSQADQDATSDAVALLPTATTPPTETPLPPTATSAPATPTPEPATPTPEPEAQDQITTLVNLLGDPAQGEQLFAQAYDEAGGQACTSCHYVEQVGEDAPPLSGPNQWGIANRAGDRVEGESAAAYIYNSIINPNDYIVEGYVANVMPGIYGDLFTTDELYHITAYLLTLDES